RGDAPFPQDRLAADRRQRRQRPGSDRALGNAAPAGGADGPGDAGNGRPAGHPPDQVAGRCTVHRDRQPLRRRRAPR
ncbi:hypothetical protein HMPREF0776_1231, partial [Staphylococcus aureus subsp. aureus USA300_TCH959]